MTEVEEEIKEAIKLLKLSLHDISILSEQENKVLYYDLLSHYVKNGDRRWWWEDFKTSFNFKCLEYPFEHLLEIIPDIDAKVWFMIEDNQKEFYPIYDTTATIIKDILSNCFGFEYYIISKDKSWLICENHHNNLIGVGNILKEHNQTSIDC